jgi:chorismate dehydratase
MIVRQIPPSASQGTGQPEANALVRLGAIDYLNVRPIYDWLLRRERADGGLASVQLVDGVPAAMNHALLAGAVDVSNVSSVAFGQHTGEWLLIPRLSVAAHGRVDSVLLFSWHKDWRALDRAPITLTSESATSIELVRLLCERRYGIQPRYRTAAPTGLDDMLEGSAAALLIGDGALEEGHRRRAIAGRGQPYVFDLAAEWQAWTGLPFVFAVWAVRREAAERARRSGVVALLRASKERGLADLDRIAAEAAERLDLPRDVCAQYLCLLDYDLGSRELDGLRAFLELAVPGFRWDAVRFFEE